MKGLCLRYVSDSENVKDILQEGFIKVFSHIKDFKGDGAFDGWIKRIFVNTAISYLRKQNRKSNYIRIEDVDESVFPENEMYLSNQNASNDNINNRSNQNTAETIWSADLSEVELLNALHKIPEKYRIVFNMFCIENIKHEEISVILDIDITTSRTRLLRARGIIQKELYSLCIEKQSQ